MKYLFMLFLMGPGISRAADCTDFSGNYIDGLYNVVITQDGCTQAEMKYFDTTLPNSPAMYDQVYLPTGNRKTETAADNSFDGSYTYALLPTQLGFLDIEHYHSPQFGERIIVSNTMLSKNTDGSILEDYFFFDSITGTSHSVSITWKKKP